MDHASPERMSAVPTSGTICTPVGSDTASNNHEFSLHITITCMVCHDMHDMGHLDTGRVLAEEAHELPHVHVIVVVLATTEITPQNMLSTPYNACDERMHA